MVLVSRPHLYSPRLQCYVPKGTGLVLGYVTPLPVLVPREHRKARDQGLATQRWLPLFQVGEGPVKETAQIAAAGSLGDDSWTDGQTDTRHTYMHAHTHTHQACFPWEREDGPTFRAW